MNIVCKTCRGLGTVRVPQGFFSIQKPCPDCVNSGKKNYLVDITNPFDRVDKVFPKIPRADTPVSVETPEIFPRFPLDN